MAINKINVYDQLYDESITNFLTSTKENYIMNFQKALNVLDVTATDNPKTIIMKFNEKMKTCSDPENQKILRNAKVLLIKEHIIDQIKKDGKFFIQNTDTSCIKCNGVGEIFKFKKVLAEIECKYCHGSGKVTESCKACNGTGRYKNESAGLKINVKCKKCDGNKSTEVKCKKCLGAGKIKKLIITPEIESTNHCKICHGTGLKDNKENVKPIKSKIYKVENPALPHEIGTMLLSAM